MEITFKEDTSLGLESYDDLGFNSEEELQLEIFLMRGTCILRKQRDYKENDNSNGIN